MVFRVRAVQHDQNDTNAIIAVHTWTSTCLRVLRVRAAKHDQSGAKAIKIGAYMDKHPP